MTREEMGLALVKNQGWMFKQALSLACNTDLARDMVQEACLKALEKFSLYRGGEWQSWIYTIIKNAFLDEMRHQTKTSDEVIPEESYDTDDRLQDIEKALDSVKDRYRVALVRYAEGYSYQEISDELGTCVNNVRTYIHQGRKAIKQYYD